MNSSILINCDIGERAIDNKIDIELMDYLHLANIACGGHAGNQESINFFNDLAKRKKMLTSAHLSYPDRENFGRVTLDINHSALKESLDQQKSHLPQSTWVKFHGALYNDACTNQKLAHFLSTWCSENKVTHIIAPHHSQITKEANKLNIKVISEFFAERRYTLDQNENLTLNPAFKTLCLHARSSRSPFSSKSIYQQQDN